MTTPAAAARRTLLSPDVRRLAGLGVVIVAGLAVDEHFAWGQVVTNVVVWLVFLRWLQLADRPGKVMLASCVLFAALGECFLTVVWGLYEYRLGNLPLFVPPGHALLLMLGMLIAARIGSWIVWLVPLAAAPVVVVQAFGSTDTLGVLLFVVLLAAMRNQRARKLYAVMFVLSLLMELYGTWLGNWTWRRVVPGLGLVTCNPPLTAGAFYCVLDALVMTTMRVLGLRGVAKLARPA